MDSILMFNDLEEVLKPKFQEYDFQYSQGVVDPPETKESFEHNFAFTEFSYMISRSLRPWHIKSFLEYIEKKIGANFDWRYAGGRAIIYGVVPNDYLPGFTEVFKRLIMRIDKIPMEPSS